MTKGVRKSNSLGFTLIEIILTVALIALMSGMLVMNIGSILKVTAIESLEHEYWRSVDSARSNAVFSQKPHFIVWNEETSTFVVSSAGAVENFELNTSEFGDVEVEVLFEEIAPENSYVLIRGELVAKREIATVGFFPDGTCTPYTVTLKIGDHESHFQMDPWTGVRLVDPNSEI